MFNSEVLTVPVRVAWIRNPLSRLQSAYCHFKHHNERGTNSQSHYIGPGVTPSWEVFVDHILLNSNKHWDSQVGMLTLDGLYLATVTERFEDISKRFGHYMPEGLELTNESIKCKTSTYRKADIAAKYKEDFALWRSLGRDKKS